MEYKLLKKFHKHGVVKQIQVVPSNYKYYGDHVIINP